MQLLKKKKKNTTPFLKNKVKSSIFRPLQSMLPRISPIQCNAKIIFNYSHYSFVKTNHVVYPTDPPPPHPTPPHPIFFFSKQKPKYCDLSSLALARRERVGVSGAVTLHTTTHKGATVSFAAAM